MLRILSEEIVISKDAVEHRERITDTVRKEEVHVDENATTDPTLVEGRDAGSSRTM